MLLQQAGGRKCFPRVPWILKHGFLCYRNKQTFLIGKKVLIVMVPILINKNMFEPSSNDLKFIVWNHNNFCTNLILVHHLFDTVRPFFWYCFSFSWGTSFSISFGVNILVVKCFCLSENSFFLPCSWKVDYLRTWILVTGFFFW